MSEGGARKLRTALGQFATGVTIVTGIDEDDQPFGMTANSFTSVSMDPPWILWNIAKSALCYERFMHAQRFSVQVLAADQKSLAEHFATRLEEKFTAVDWSAGEHELPRFEGVLAELYCRQVRLLDGGDHMIVIGEVESYSARDDRAPLLFYSGDFRELG